MTRPRRLYWAVQLAGWAAVLGAFAGLAAATGNVGGEWTAAEAVVSTAGFLAALVGASHALRMVVLRLRGAGALRLGLGVAASALALGALVETTSALLNAGVRLAQGEAPEWRTPGASANAAFTAAILLSLWALAYVLFTTAGRLRQSEREALGLRAALAEAELAALRVQTNPHFLFNALNTVRALIPADPEAARGAVTRLSALLRGSLAGTDLHALQDELGLVHAYLDLERLRFEERLSVAIDVDDAALGVPVPALAVLTLVENAVKHGVADRPEGGTVRVSARLGREGSGGDRLRVAVENPPAPHGSHPEGTGSGLRLVRERLGLLYGGGASLHVHLGADPVVVEITLPVRP